MAIGCFFIVVDNAENARKAVYLTSDAGIVELGDNEWLRIRTGHSDKPYVLTPMADYQLFSYKIQMDVKRRVVEMIGGVILEKDVSSLVHKDSLKIFTEKMVDFREKPNNDLVIVIEQKYSQYFDQPQFILDTKEVEARLTDKIKNLNKKGKFDEANVFLEKMKKIPKKLYSAHETAEIALKNLEFEKAEKEYENAKKYANDLEEKELVQMYKAKINLARKTPSLIKKRDDEVAKAMNGLRSDDFSNAQRHFKKAADLSEELMDSSHAEEYSSKARALAEYVKIDSKFNK